MRKKAMVFAPLPPPVGGIATISGMLKELMEKKGEVLFVKAWGVSNRKMNSYTRPFANIFKIVVNLFKVKRHGTVLFFSSAYTSFFEKLFWSLLVTLLGRTPLIVMVDGNFPRFYENISPIKKKVIDILIRVQPRLTFGAQSEYWKDYYTSIFSDHRVNVVSASADSLFFELIQKRNSTSKGLVFLYIGWIIQDKGIYDLLDAISIVSKKINRNLSFKLVGPLFDKEAYWHSELEKRDIHNSTFFTGPMISRESILHEYRNADVFVFPSHYEGFPVSLLEAITTGLPCIATSVGGIPDILDNGKAGILVDSKSPEQLANGMLKLIQNSDYRQQLSKNAYERARTNYNFENLLKSYCDILNLN